MDKLELYLRKVSGLLENPLRGIAVGFSMGLALGFIGGMLMLLVLKKDVSGYALLGGGAVLGVVLEVVFKFLYEAFQAKRLVHPLVRVLGTIGTEESWIYLSGWRRDLDDLEHSRLYRNDSKRSSQPMIIGSQFVYGKGDATALSYIYQAIEKATKGKTRVNVEDSEQMLNYWDRNVICIGAHNSKTREILAKFKNPYYRFEMNYRIIVESNGVPITNRAGQKFIDGVKASLGRDSSDIDYAIIVKLTNEYHSGKNILIVAGLGDNGTAGAAYYLLNKYKELPFEQDEFGVLIEVPSGYESARKVDFHEVSRCFDLNVSDGGRTL